ncbi:MAG: hypothetical protein KBD12_01120 [Candidatus Pacebacteria bacterium]|nr:hypothetical protein [Candidatus Paceibacterota bacterium]
MDNNENINKDKNKGLLKLIFPIILIVLFIIGYFVYKGFFEDSPGDSNSATNAYLSGTKLSKDVDIINKENLSFTLNLNNQLAKEDHSAFEYVSPSQQVGRNNPFLP